MGERLQPFPANYARDADMFVAMSGELASDQLDWLHRHDFYELVWLWHGRCTFFSDFNRYRLEEGTLIFISPGQLHDYIITESFIRLLIIGFRPNILPAVAPHLTNILPFDDTERSPILPISAAQKPIFAQLFETAHARFDARVAGWKPIVTTYLQTILTEAAYLMPPEFMEQATTANVQLTRAFQQNVERHYRTQQKVQDYAAMLGVTTNHLVKTVRQTTSMTPKQMLQGRLLLEAKRLLVHTPYPVSQISELLHFANNSTFSRWFKNQTNQSPTQFRQISPLA
ncbi:MAG: AraC family transcriptional regulator [Chloroflexota bacterium]